MFFDWSALKKLIWLRAAGIIGAVWKTITNAAVASFTAVAAPVRELVVDIDPVQDLHGYDSPWPGGGGKNKIYLLRTTDKEVYGITIHFNGDGTFTANGTATRSVDTIISAKGLESGSYVLNGNASDVSTSDAWLFTLPNYHIGRFTDSVEGTYLHVESGKTLTNALYKPMIRLATESDATFAPYSNICPISGWTRANIWVQPTHDTTANPTVTIDLDGTRYGGTLNVTTGVLTVTMAEVDLGTLTYNYTAPSSSYPYGLFATASLQRKNGRSNLYSDRFKKGASASFISDNSIIGNNNTNQFWITCSLYNSAESFKTAMSGAQLVYELTTPQTYQLTPAEVTTLLGQNNVWADTGNINSLTYRADVELYIAKKLAEA